MAGLFNWGARKTAEEPPAPLQPSPDRSSATDRVTASKVLPKVLAALAQTTAPVVMDLGPVVGPNIAFLGEQLACKIFVEDLFADVEACAKRQAPGDLLEIVGRKPARAERSIDGILCWDLFDYLDKGAAQVLAGRLQAMLRPGGVLYAFFGTAAGDVSSYTRFVVESPDTLKLRSAPATRSTRHVRVNRDINRMFDGLVVVESVLLKTSTRETLFRKA